MTFLPAVPLKVVGGKPFPFIGVISRDWGLVTSNKREERKNAGRVVDTQKQQTFHTCRCLNLPQKLLTNACVDLFPYHSPIEQPISHLDMTILCGGERLFVIKSLCDGDFWCRRAV